MIDTQALRKKILDAAIRGKLTEQLPEDGNAEDLYKEIQAENQKLIKEGKVKKEKLLSEITEDEIPFDIPENWKWCRVGEIFDLQAGKNIAANGIHAEASLDHPYRCFGGNGIRGYVKKHNWDGEHTIIGRQGALCGNVKKANGIFYATEHAVVVTGFAKPCINWQYYFLTALNLNQYATATAQPGLAVAKVNEVLIPLPPLAEQKRIVSKIESILSKLDLIEQEQKKLSDNSIALRNKLIQLGISGGLTKQLPEDGNAEDLYKEIQAEKQRLIKEGKIKKEKPLPEIAENDIPFDIPGNWKWVYMGNIFSHNTGKALNQSNTDGTLLTYITTSNLYWEGFVLNNLRSMKFTESELDKCTIRKGDLLVCEGGDVGRSAIWPYDFEMRIQNHIHKLRAYVDVCTKYYWYVLYLYKLSELIGGKGIGIQGLSSNALHKLIVPLPPLAEQKRIVEKLDQLLPLCDAMKADISGGVGA